MKKLLHKCLLVPLGHVLPVLVAVSPAFAAEQANHRPNLVYILTDQQWAGAMSCAGNSDLSTPALDGQASRGVRFHNAYCTQPLCVHSRTAMMTGVYPHEIGATHNTFAWDRAPVPILGKVLVQSGYECAWFGKWHLPIKPADVEEHGFTTVELHKGSANDSAQAEVSRKSGCPHVSNVRSIASRSVVPVHSSGSKNADLLRSQRAVVDTDVVDPPTEPDRVFLVPATADQQRLVVGEIAEY